MPLREPRASHKEQPPQNEDFTALGRIRTLPRFHRYFSLLLIVRHPEPCVCVQQQFEPPVPVTESVKKNQILTLSLNHTVLSLA
ncbi:Hypothetical protein SMAX5B_021093 [Scophthalmus maximus]|uniref:Uncharacterized protein n=1 Tax=Scophthalmus maximus TaxID=52904 RepID=A0A2U9CB43_SCOMX|nr:Hypothetical protein SMAX5B_021093 [Scophthalmus maximus]